MDPDIMREDEVAQITGAVPERTEIIPETFSPEFRSDEPEPRDEGREYEEAQEYPFILSRSLLKPW